MQISLRSLSPHAALVLGFSLVGGEAQSQTPGQPASARVETAPLELVAPDRYQVPVVLEAERQVAVMATADGIVQALPARVGDLVKERQELVLLDRTEAAARLKIAEAELKGCQAQLAAAESAQGGPTGVPGAKAQVEAAQARVELAQLAVERCTLRAPFSGLLLDYPVSNGQYVPAGTVVALLADVTRLRVLLPVDRKSVQVGDTVQLPVEGASISGKVQAILPLPRDYAPLRELATSWAAALVLVDNPDGRALQPGLRVRPPLVPDAPVTTLSTRALRGAGGSGGSTVQVVRNEHVTGLPVTVLGSMGPERVQVKGAFRAGDLAIVDSSIPLAEGTYLRFSDAPGRPLELTPPDPNARGNMAEVTAPAAAPTGATTVAPIGRPDSAVPAARRPVTGNSPAGSPATTKPAARPPAPGGAAPAPF